MAYNNLDGLCQLMHRFGKAKLDMVWAVTGRKGMGKSTFAIQIAKRYLEKYKDEKWKDPRKYIAYDNDEVMEKIKELPPGSPLVCDEAARFAMGEDWNKRQNKEMKKLVAQMRTKNMIMIMCIPRFRWMDAKYREDMISHWVWIPFRGKAYIFMPDDNPGERDAWHFKDFWRLGRIDFTVDPTKVDKAVKKHRCFWDDVVFPSMNKSFEEKYLLYRDKKAFAKGDVGGMLGDKLMTKFLMYNLRRNIGAIIKDEVIAKRKDKYGKRNTMTYDSLSKYLGISPINQYPFLTAKMMSVMYNEVGAMIEEARRKKLAAIQEEVDVLGGSEEDDKHETEGGEQSAEVFTRSELGG